MTSVLGTNLGHGERPDPADLREAGCRSVRFVLEPHRDDMGYIVACRNHEIDVLGVLARESFRDEPRRPHLENYRRYRHLIRGYQVGNEPDLDSPSSWTMAHWEYARLVQETRMAMPDAYLVGAGLASGDPNWLLAVPIDMLDAIAVHPYGQTPDASWGTFDTGAWGFGVAGGLVDRYAAYGMPIWVTEYGAPDWQLARRVSGGLISLERYLKTMRVTAEALRTRTVTRRLLGIRAWDRYADYIGGMTAAMRDHPAVAAAYQFAWSDAVPGFGLHRADGSRKPAYGRFREEALRQEVPTVPEQQAFNIGPGFRAAIEQHGLVPQGDETYLTPDLSVLPTDRAALYYLKRANEVKLVWWDTVG